MSNNDAVRSAWERLTTALDYGRKITPAIPSWGNVDNDQLLAVALFSLTTTTFAHYHWYKNLCNETNRSFHIYSKYARFLEQEEEHYSSEVLKETSYQSLVQNLSSKTSSSNDEDEHLKKKTSLDLYEKVKSVLFKNPYHPSIYTLYDIKGQLQTSIQYFVRNFTRVLFQTSIFSATDFYIQYERELIRLPDNGTVAIDWVLNCVEGEQEEETLSDGKGNSQKKGSKPILLIHHGLNGDSQSEYFYHLLSKLCKQNLYSKIGILIARGCGGLPLTSFTTFTGRRSYDLFYVVKYVKNLFPENKLFWIGYSLGAAITLHYLEDFPKLIEEEQEENDYHEELQKLQSNAMMRVSSSDRLVLNVAERAPFTLENLQKHNNSTPNSRNNSVHDFLALESSYITTAASLAQQKRLERLQRRKEVENSGIDAALCVCPPWNISRQGLGFNIWSILLLIPLKLYMLQHLDSFKQFNPFGNNSDVELMTLFRLMTIKDINELDRFCYRFYGANYSLESLKTTTSDHLEYIPTIKPNMNEASSSSVSKNSKNKRQRKGKRSMNHDVQIENRRHVHIRYKEDSMLKDTLSVGGDLTDTSGFSNSGEENSEAKDFVSTQINNNSNYPVATVRYKTLEEYYLDTSPKYKAHQITTPTLAISARDDPICAAEECPQAPHEIGHGLVVVTTKHGGHLAFPNGIFTATDSWIDNIVIDWFKQFS